MQNDSRNRSAASFRCKLMVSKKSLSSDLDKIHKISGTMKEVCIKIKNNFISTSKKILTSVQVERDSH